MEINTRYLYHKLISNNNNSVDQIISVKATPCFLNDLRQIGELQNIIFVLQTIINIQLNLKLKSSSRSIRYHAWCYCCHLTDKQITDYQQRLW